MPSPVTERFIHCHNKLRESKVVRSSRQFALSLDYLPQSLSEILKGRRDVTIELLRKAVSEYKINPVYIFTGDGPLFMTEEDHQSFRVLTVVSSPQDDERIVHVPVPAQSGYAEDSGDPKFIQDLPTFTLPDYKYKVGTHRSFDVSGDSMEPTLFEGDKVICSFLEPTLWESSLKDNYVYVIVTRADVMVTRVFNLLKEEKKLRLKPDNGSYEEFYISPNEIREMWYVRAKISPFLPSPLNLNNLLREEVHHLRQTIAEQSRTLQNLSNSMDRFNTQNNNHEN